MGDDEFEKRETGGTTVEGIGEAALERAAQSGDERAGSAPPRRGHCAVIENKLYRKLRDGHTGWVLSVCV